MLRLHAYIKGIIELVEDTCSNVILAVQEDWGCSLAELGPLSPADFFNILAQCFEASWIISFYLSKRFADAVRPLFYCRLSLRSMRKE